MGEVKKWQRGLKLPNNYLSKQYVAKSESTNIDPKLTYAKPTGTKTNKNAWYRFMDDHPILNTAYDAVNTGLYLAAPYTAGATLPFATGMTLAQGAAGVDDIIENKPNVTNVIDVASLIPGLGLTKTLGKQTTRAAARAATKAGVVELLKPGSWSAMRANKAALNAKLLSKYTKGAFFLGDTGLDFLQLKNDYSGLK